MIFQPVLHPVLLALLFVAVAVVTVRALIKNRGERALWALRLLLLAACFFALLRPGLPGGSSQTLATDTDVVLVVDTTASIVAEDWGDETRLDGVREDVSALVAAYPGARFALITFDAAAELRLPLTTDTTALVSSLDVLTPEVTAQSRGSSIGIANRMLEETLQRAAESSPDRSRMVFYFGDGEQTLDSAPESFAKNAELIDGGGVLGYGTAEGGPMKITTGLLYGNDSEYIEYEGQRALSVIDEENLKNIAADLGVSYQLRSPDTAPTLPAAPTSTTSFAGGDEAGTVIELYWIAAIVIVLLLGVEVARATLLITRMRTLVKRGES